MNRSERKPYIEINEDYNDYRCTIDTMKPLDFDIKQNNDITLYIHKWES